MLKKSSIWLVVLISVVAIAFIATGCAKKQVVKEEAAAKPVVEVKKEEPAPEPPKVAEAPKEEPKPEPVKEAAAPEPKKEEAPPPPPAPAKVEPLALVAMRIQFAFDDYNLSTKAKENLEKVASWMSKDPAVKIQVEGHTCEVGTNEYNLALGERQANSAKKYLEGMGVNPARLSTISYGEERPMVPNSDEANRSKNRRDEFLQSK
jgi:peptidoglycan-associated lipoprotein